MGLYDVNTQREEAEQTIRDADKLVRQLAWLLRGRLRIAGVYSSELRALKKELRDFNMTTGEWSESK